ncbi:MAG: DUF2958 domain-containing protein [Chloroflexi bacterium]|nr:DUF2958 domain-containing protein [Chloroflexota bacterium]
MQLLTKELLKQFPEIGATEKIPAEEKEVVAKFFDPTGSWTWYAVEFDGKDQFFGLVDGFELEWGYFSLSELQSIKGAFGLGIERDLYFGHPKIKDVPALQGRL